MGIPWDDGVLIQHGKKPSEPTVVTVNCPDKVGLGCDICRIILEFGLCITRGDFQTDGKWCYIVLWTIPQENTIKIDWDSLKNRLQAACPSCSMSFLFNQQLSSSSPKTPPPIYLLKVFCLDRKGLLHDVTKVLSKLELTIERVKVTTIPDDNVLDLFFITDTMNHLHTKERRDETCRHLTDVLREHCISCELLLSVPEFHNQQETLSFSPEVAEQLFRRELSTKEVVGSLPLNSEMKSVKKVSITVDNYMSPAHTLLQIQCIDQKSLVYDILRTLKDCNIQVAYGRISQTINGFRNVDLFIQKTDGRKIVDPDTLSGLCSHLKEEMLHPFGVTITSRGPETILLVANPVEASEFGRPRVFYDVTLALKLLGICIFSAEVVRHSTSERQWEVYRLLLDDSPNFPLSSPQRREEIVNKVKRTLM